MEAPKSEDRKPSVYLLMGDDMHAMQGIVRDLIAHMGDPVSAEMNITRLDGSRALGNELAEAVNAYPFLVERRLVILENPLAGLRSESAQMRFTSLLDGVPPSTALVLLLEDEYDWRGNSTRFTDKHWLVRWMNSTEQAKFVKVCRLPGAAEMPKWIQDTARKLGGQFSRPAAEALAQEVGSNTEQATREIEKLLTYVNGQRAVEPEDVQELTAPGGEWDIFDMVEAMGGGDKRTALQYMHHLLDEQDARSLFGMIVRQFRQLIMVREMLDEGSLSVEEGRKVGIKSAYQLNKLAGQARNFDIPALKAAYHRLMEMDEQMKSSQIDPSVALDVFIAEL